MEKRKEPLKDTRRGHPLGIRMGKWKGKWKGNWKGISKDKMLIPSGRVWSLWGSEKDGMKCPLGRWKEIV